jgi:hypothetical protein
MVLETKPAVLTWMAKASILPVLPVQRRLALPINAKV